MNLRNDEEKRVRSYLLGELPQEEIRQLEEKLLREEEFAEQVLLIEDELIEDYAGGDLPPGERKRFEEHFLSTPRRRLKLMTVRGLKSYTPVSADAKQLAADPSPRGWRFAFAWLRKLFFPRWRAVAFAALILVVGVGLWRVYFYSPPSERALLALREAYAGERPLEMRITGFTYAPFQETRRGEAASSDTRARDRSAALIHDEADPAGHPSPAALHNLGRLYLAQKEFDKALSAFDEALKATPDDASLHSDAGTALFEKGKLERANNQSGKSEVTLAESLTHFDRALNLDSSLQEARFNRALLYMTLNLSQQAADDWQKYLTQDPGSRWADEAREHLRLIEEQRGRASLRTEDLFGGFARAYSAGDQEQAWRVFSQSHLRTGNVITGRLIDDYLESSAKGRRDGVVDPLLALSQLGQLSEQKVGDRFTADLAHVYASAAPSRRILLAQARATAKEAYASYTQSRNDYAIELYGQAKRLFEQGGDFPEALLADYGIGHCYSQQPDTPRSLLTFEALASECERRGYRWLHSLALNGLANVRTRLAQYTRAVDHSWDSYRLSTSIGDDNGALRSLNTLASLYRNLGGYHQSLRLARQGLDLAARISADDSQRVGLYATSAWSLTALGYYAPALEYEKEAVHLGEKMNSPLALSRYHVQLGLIHERLRNSEEALKEVRLGLEIGRGVRPENIGDEMTTYALLYIGRIYRESGLFGEAADAIEQVIHFCQQKNESWLLHEALKEQLLTHIAQGQVGPAKEELAGLLATYEEERGKILEESNRNTFFDNEQEVYDLAIDFAHTTLKDARQSFEYSESSRARSLLDTSTGDWKMQTRASLPDVRFSEVVRPLTLDAIRGQMPERAQILQYAVLRDKVIIWYVSREKFDSRVVDVSMEELSGKVALLVSDISQPPAVGGEEEVRKSAAALYAILLRPVAGLLDPGKQLFVVPDKALNLLPFDALFSAEANRYVTEDFLLGYAPSSNMFIRDTEAARQKGGAKDENLLSVGNPLFDRGAFTALGDLPSAEREATEITTFYGLHALLIGPQATKNAVISGFLKADVLHLATHYLPDPESPMLSKLLLARPAEHAVGRPSPDGVLETQEIYKLGPVRARLVILSACQTGVEDYVKGEGALGLFRPFQASGVPLIIASLWPVDSPATADLMITFHRLRRLGGMNAVAALRGARLQMLNGQSPEYRHPYYWASFAAIGGYAEY